MLCPHCMHDYFPHDSMFLLSVCILQTNMHTCEELKLCTFIQLQFLAEHKCTDTQVQLQCTDTQFHFTRQQLQCTSTLMTSRPSYLPVLTFCHFLYLYCKIYEDRNVYNKLLFKKTAQNHNSQLDPLVALGLLHCLPHNFYDMNR